ncbi:MAG: hypothetical protein CVV04_11715 [Firmicutes bacterium HGW-Firmicutes-9]|jgi:hypothetical protein|nr:MAG: hypothetical protein CVV04_11715 [Firmicutes bacterium HGW-Firmicutes-9]
MKLAKRIFAILLLVTLSLSMVACAEVNVLGVSTPTTALAVSDGSTVSDSETPVAYKNDYFKYTCVLPDDWYVLNQDEMSEMLGIAKDALGEGDASDIIKKSLDDGTSTMDFYAVSGNGTQTINIVLGKVTLLQRLLSEKQLLEASLPLMSAGLENMGAQNITYTNETVTILGKEHAATFVSAEYQGISLTERVCLILKGSYLSTITITDMAGNSPEDALAYFQPID